MDVVYGTLFFTYPSVPFSKVEGFCALCLAIGAFLSWVEDATVQCVALLLQIFGCGYWIVCFSYGILIKDNALIIFSTVLCFFSFFGAFTRGPDYIFKEDPDLETPFWVVTILI